MDLFFFFYSNTYADISNENVQQIIKLLNYVN